MESGLLFIYWQRVDRGMQGISREWTAQESIHVGVVYMVDFRGARSVGEPILGGIVMYRQLVIMYYIV